MATEQKPGMYYFCADHPFAEDKLTIGGLALTERSVESVSQSLEKNTSKKPVTWDNLTTSNVKRAQLLLEEFCRLLNENKAHYHLRFTSIQQVDIIHKMELSERVKIAHLYYHLILQRPFRFYVDKYDLHIRPANEDVKIIFDKMRVRIHKDCFDLYGTRHDPVTSLETSDINNHPINEMVNLTVSVTTILRHKAQVGDLLSDVQRSLVTSFENAINLPNLFGNSGAMEQRFSIWNDEPSLEHSGFRGLF